MKDLDEKIRAFAKLGNYLSREKIDSNLNDQITNFNSMILTKNDQLSLSEELSKKLKKDLQKQKLKTKLVGLAGIGVAVGILVIAK